MGIMRDIEVTFLTKRPPCFTRNPWHSTGSFKTDMRLECKKEQRCDVTSDFLEACTMLLAAYATASRRGSDGRADRPAAWDACNVCVTYNSGSMWWWWV